MDFQFEQLGRFPLDTNKKEDDEIQAPQWHCFCCHDSGYINPNLVKRVIPDFDYYHDRQPACQATNCNIIHGKTNLHNSLDWRIESNVCDRLALLEKQSWKEWEKNRIELITKAKSTIDEFTTSF